MDMDSVTRLNRLFEKVVSDCASMAEHMELNILYQEYINDGRDNLTISQTNNSAMQYEMRN